MKMKNHGVHEASLYALAFSIVVALSAASSAEAAPVKRSGELSGRIVAKKGGEEATLVPTKGWRDAEVRQDLKAGDILRTNRSGTLAIVFADKTQIRLGRNSTLVVKRVRRGSPSAVKLTRGRVWGRSPRGRTNLSVETPSATAAIRGTEWAITADDTQSSLQVFSGAVELFNDQGSLLISKGQAAQVLLGQAPTRVALVNPLGREQMLYFVRIDDGLEMMANDNPAFDDAISLTRKGDWAGAKDRLAALETGSATPRDRTIATFGRYIAERKLGLDTRAPEIEESAIGYAGRAFIASYEGDLRKAITTAEEGLVRFPNEPMLYEVKARIALLLGEPKLTGDTLASGLERFPKNAALLAFRAEMLNDYDSQPRQALKVAKAAIKLNENRAETLSTLANIRYERGANREARTAVEKAIEIHPNDAGLHAQRASILLAQNEIDHAKASLDRALEIDPSLSIVRTTMADYYVRKAKLDKAMEEALAASADNPSYGRSLVQLAELNYQMGQTDVALQNLDAADRLDGDNAVIPLARAAIALHRYSADDAIKGAREALNRFQARGGIYASLSEDQDTGSLVSRSFRFLGLEAWGRYYGDRVFDTFSPTSYPDQVLNQTASPFLLRPSRGTFDAFNGTDNDQLSSFLQGATLSPLSVANSRRKLQFADSNFIEGSLGGFFLDESERHRIGIDASVDAIINGSIPTAIAITAQRSRAHNSLPVENVSPFIDRTENEDAFVSAFVGLEPSPQDKILFFGSYGSQDTDNLFNNQIAFQDPDITPARYTFRRLEDRDTSAFLFWGHEFSDRNILTLGGGIGSMDSLTFRVDRFSQNTPNISSLETDQSFTFLTANYALAVGPVDLKIGAELMNIRIDDIQDRFSEDGNENLTSIGGIFPFTQRADINERRLYADIRYKVNPSLIVQAQLSYLHEKNTSNILSNGRNEDSGFNYQLGLAYEPARGHWLRLAALKNSASEVPFTQAPINVVGLKGTLAPAEQNSDFSSYIARWDAEWTPHFFTSFSYQHQEFDALSYDAPRSFVNIRSDRAKLDRFSLEANLWLTGNIGIRASYAHTLAKARAPFNIVATVPFQPIFTPIQRGDKLPFVVTDNAQLGITWVKESPWRIKARLFADYFGRQTDDIGNRSGNYIVVNSTIQWEPLGRHIKFDAGIFNIFDQEYQEASGFLGPGRTVQISAKVRF